MTQLAVVNTLAVWQAESVARHDSRAWQQTPDVVGREGMLLSTTRYLTNEGAIMRKGRLIVLTTILALIIAGFGSDAALAASPGTPGASNAQGCQHVVVKAVPRGSKEQPSVQCFDTQQQAAAASAAMRPDGYFALGTFYKNADRGGSSSLIINGTSCNGTTSEIWDLFSGWNDTISSMDIACDGVSLYDNAYEAGDNQYYGSGYTNYVGSYMNDRTSSVYFYTTFR